MISELGFALCDDEGRYVQVDFGRLSIASLYLPSGSSGAERQAQKFAFLEKYQAILAAQLASGREFIITGDFNIVHRDIDI